MVVVVVVVVVVVAVEVASVVSVEDDVVLLYLYRLTGFLLWPYIYGHV
jgi:hypothetical protein